MTGHYRNRQSHYKPRTLTAKAKRAAFDAQRPLDSTAQMPSRTKRVKREKDGLDGIGGADHVAQTGKMMGRNGSDGT